MVLTVPRRTGEPGPDLVKIGDFPGYAGAGRNFSRGYLTLVVICAGIWALPGLANTQKKSRLGWL